MISEDQIKRFFTKQCTAEEAAQVAAWLKAHPDVAGKYLEEREWQQASSHNEHLPEEISDSVWRRIHVNIRRRKAVVLLKRSAVAACIAGCLAVGFYYFNNAKPVSSPVVHLATNASATGAPVDTVYNYTNASRRFLLQDSSVITLFPHSFVWFDAAYNKARRDVHLQGEARFEVAKNKQKPFTVYAGAFATTALGTEFIVKQQNNNINVQLMHGKVVIKAAGNSIANWKDVYLMPGQQMTYQESDALTRVSFIQNNKNSPVSKTIAKKNAGRETADSLIFRGSTLSTVLKKLHSYYNVRIQFADADIKDISFTGVIVKKDSVQNILKVITQMNGLSLEESNGDFIISKNKN